MDETAADEIAREVLSLESRRFPNADADLWTTIWTGGYPRIHQRGLDPAEWLSDYVETYVQRDVRQVLNVADLSVFATFLRLVAGRTAASEVLKARVHRAFPADLFHLREVRGAEVDLLVEDRLRVVAVEAKSGATLSEDFFRGLRSFREEAADRAGATEVHCRLVYGGNEGQTRYGIEWFPGPACRT